MRPLLAVRAVLVVGLVASCAPPALAPVHDERAELATIAAIGSADSLWDVLGEPIARGRRYAVIDDRGYVGTLRAESPIPCMLACTACCMKPQWMTKWLEPPLRSPPEGIVLAIGPVDGRCVSARRQLPDTLDPERNPWEWMFVRTPDFRTLALFSFSSEPRLLEARGRRSADGGRVIELRVRERETWRLVSRTIEDGDRNRGLD